MFIAIPVTPEGMIDSRWGRARQVAIAHVGDDNKLISWTVHTVRWDELHDEGGHGKHHARIVRFLRDNMVDAVMVGHMGQGMVHTIGKMGLVIVMGASGDGRVLAQRMANDIRASSASNTPVTSYKEPHIPQIGHRSNLL